MSTFDIFADELEQGRAHSQRPFWTLDLDDEDTLKKWLVQQYDFLADRNEHNVRTWRRNLAALRGLQIRNHTRTGDLESRRDARLARNPKMVINHLLDMLELHVSKTTKFRPNTAAEPASEDTDDKNVAKIADELLDALWYKEDIDDIFQQHNRIKRYFGESYLHVGWNPHKGKMHPDYIREVFKKNNIDRNPRDMTCGEIRRLMNKEVKELPRIALKDESGKTVTNDLGEPLYIDQPVRIGEIEYSLWLPWEVLLQPKHKYRDVEWCFYYEIDDVDNVKADHPDKAQEVQSNSRQRYYDLERFKDETISNAVEVFHFFHKTTKHLDQGRYIKFTRDVILENTVNPYELDDGKILPFDRLTDVDVPGILAADSMVRHARPAHHVYNNTVSMIARNQFQFAHPKWFVPANSVKPESLSNQTSLVTYKGPQAPILAQANPTGNEAFKVKQDAKEDLQQLMGVFGQSRGEPPPGVKAGVALQFLDEQENERETSAVAKHNASIRNVARMSLSIMGNHYDDDDGRLSDLLGKSRASEISYFQFADLSTIVDVKVRAASALPRQKAARIQTILDLSERYPEELDGRQVLDMIDLGQSDKFINMATVAVRAAEKENDMLLRTGSMSSPEKWEDHLAHYKIHVTSLNETSYKMNMSKSMLEAMKDHIAAHEMLMQEIMMKNPMYMQQIMTLYPNFPIFYDEGLGMPMQPMGADPLQGAQGAIPEQMAQPPVPVDAANEMPIGEAAPPQVETPGVPLEGL